MVEQEHFEQRQRVHEQCGQDQREQKKREP
jgi:hypothetical protein